MKRFFSLLGLGLLLAIIGCDKNPSQSVAIKDGKTPVIMHLLGKVRFSDGTVYETTEMKEFVLPERFWTSARPFTAQELGIKPEPRQNSGLQVNTPPPYDYYFTVADGIIEVIGRSFVTFGKFDVGPMTLDLGTWHHEPRTYLLSYATGSSWVQYAQVYNENNCSEDVSLINVLSPHTTKTVSCAECWYSGDFSDWYYSIYFNLCDEDVDIVKVLIDTRGSASSSYLIFSNIQVHLQGYQ